MVGAVAWIGALAAALVFGRAIAARLASWIAAACAAADGNLSGAGIGNGSGIGFGIGNGSSIGSGTPVSPASVASGLGAHPAGSLVADVLALALPILAAAALAAPIAHVAQTRGLWLPRRSVRGAPALETPRTRHAALGLVGGVAVGAVTLGWLWMMAPRLALLVQSPAAGAMMLAAFAATLAAVWIAIGVLDALVRHADLTRSLRMTAAEKREDERLAGADPRWRARRAEAARGPSVRDAVAGASVVLLADGAAVAVAWDPMRRPIPVRTATGRDARATQILGLARRHGIAVHRDPDLALALADGDGPVPEALWARLAEIIAATRR